MKGRDDYSVGTENKGNTKVAIRWYKEVKS